MNESAKKVVAVSGAFSGIGLAVTKRLISDGYVVLGISRSADKRFAKLIEDGFFGNMDVSTNIHALSGDISDGNIADASLNVINGLGYGLHGIVTCAGVWVPGSVLQTSRAQWESAFKHNTTTAFSMIKMALPALIENGGGSIVCVASNLGYSTIEHCAPYAAAKAALIQLSKCVAYDYGASGIRCNCICPAFIKTDMTRSIVDDKTLFAEVVSEYPLARVGEPKDVSGLASFLLSKDSEWITGTQFAVDGGHSLH